jgi:hypothetical protein
VLDGKPDSFICSIVGYTVGDVERDLQMNVYRRIPVAKQSDSHEREAAAESIRAMAAMGISVPPASEREGANCHPPSLLPTDAKARKDTPIGTGFIDYFPLAIAEVARVSKAGNDQHNPGKPLHWDRSKSGDEADALIRHFMERGKRDSDGQLHSAKLAWRAMAHLEKELEAAGP